MTWRLLTRWSRDDFGTLAECTYMMRHLTWREDDGAWLGEAHGKVAAACYGTADEFDDEDFDMTTYINPSITPTLMDRAWPIARAYCRATWAIGGQPELGAAVTLSHDDASMVAPLRAAIYELVQQHESEA